MSFTGSSDHLDCANRVLDFGKYLIITINLLDFLDLSIIIDK